MPVGPDGHQAVPVRAQDSGAVSAQALQNLGVRMKLRGPSVQPAEPVDLRQRGICGTGWSRLPGIGVGPEMAVYDELLR